MTIKGLNETTYGSNSVILVEGTKYVISVNLEKERELMSKFLYIFQVVYLTLSLNSCLNR